MLTCEHYTAVVLGFDGQPECTHCAYAAEPAPHGRDWFGPLPSPALPIWQQSRAVHQAWTARTFAALGRPDPLLAATGWQPPAKDYGF